MARSPIPVERPWAPRSPTLAGTGALVSSVKSGGPADLAGIKTGDIITAISGQSVTGAQAVADVLVALKPDQEVTVNLLHSDGTAGSVTVTLTELQ